MSTTRRPRLPRKGEAILDLQFHVIKWISSSKKIRGSSCYSYSGEGEVADSVCNLEGTTYQITTSLDMSRPGMNKISEYI